MAGQLQSEEILEPDLFSFLGSYNEICEDAPFKRRICERCRYVGSFHIPNSIFAAKLHFLAIHFTRCFVFPARMIAGDPRRFVYVVAIRRNPSRFILQ